MNAHQLSAIVNAAYRPARGLKESAVKQERMKEKGVFFTERKEG